MASLLRGFTGEIAIPAIYSAFNVPCGKPAVLFPWMPGEVPSMQNLLRDILICMRQPHGTTCSFKL